MSSQQINHLLNKNDKSIISLFRPSNKHYQNQQYYKDQNQTQLIIYLNSDLLTRQDINKVNYQSKLCLQIKKKTIKMDEEFLIFYLLLIHHFLITLKYKMIKVLLVLVFIHLSCCLTSSVWAFYPSNKYISTGSYMFDTSMSYNNLSATSPLVAVVPFNNSQLDNLYVLGVSLLNIHYNIVNNIINIFATKSNQSASSFVASISSTYIQSIQMVGFQYLVISSNFKKMDLYSHTTPLGITLCYNTNYSQNLGGLTPMSPYTQLNINSWFTGLDIKTNYALYKYCLELGIGLTGDSTIQSIVYYQKNISCMVLNSYSFLLLRYYTNISTNPMGVEVYSFSAGNPVTYIDTNIRIFNSFFGFYHFYIKNSATFDFAFNVSTGIIKLNTSVSNYSEIYGCISFFLTSLLCGGATPYFHSPQNICYDSCPVRYYNNFNFSCTLCPYDCYTCSNSGNGDCISCNNSADYRKFDSNSKRCIAIYGYYDTGLNKTIAEPCLNSCQMCGLVNGSYSCFFCDSGTFPAIGGCSNVQHCVQVIPNTTKCLICNSQFILISTSNSSTCSCPSGQWVITNHCTDIKGCLITNNVNGKVICLKCKKYSIFVNGLCICYDHFQYNETILQCQQICGDGLVFYLGCDDGNLIDGDGCSSLCKVQQDYKCLYGSQNHSSYCFYQDLYTLKLMSIDKTQNQNQGIFVFRMVPAFLIPNANLVTSLAFSCQQQIDSVSWGLIDGKLTVTVDYAQSLQGNQANISLTLNTNFVNQQTLNITFLMNSKGMKLLLCQEYPNVLLIQNILLGISVSCLLIFVTGSIFHKMIGVQTLNVFQTVLFLFSISGNYTESQVQFKRLTVVNLNFGYFLNKQNNLNLWQLDQILSFNPSNMYLTKYIISSFLIVSVLLILLLTVWNYNLEQKPIPLVSIILIKCLKFIYNRVAFPLAIGFLFINLFTNKAALFQTPTLTYQCPIIIQIIEIFLTIVTSVIYFFQWSRILGAKSFNCIHERVGARRNYIPKYLVYISLNMTLFWLTNHYNFRYTLHLNAAITLIFLLWFIYRQPYSNKLHLVGELTNLTIIFLFCIWLILRQYFIALTIEKIQVKITLAIIFIMTFAIIINFIRVIYEIQKFVCENKVGQQKCKPNQQPTKEREYDSGNEEIDNIIQICSPHSPTSHDKSNTNKKWKKRFTQMLLKPPDQFYKQSQDAAIMKSNRSKCGNNYQIFNRDELKLIKTVNFRYK